MKWRFVFGWALVSLALLATLRAETTPAAVTITKPTPIEVLAADGTVSAVKQAPVGARMSLVRVAGADVMLRDGEGTRYRLALSSTDANPLAPADTTAAPMPAADPATAAPLDAPVSTPPTPDKTINIRDRGAVGDGVTDDTRAIQAALDDAKKLGPGAAVYVPAGNYLCASKSIFIAGCNDFTLYGDGPTSVLVQKNPEEHVLNVNDSSKITVRKINLDRADYYFTQGTIDTEDDQAKTLDVTLDAGYPPPDDPLLATDDNVRIYRAADCGYYDMPSLATSGPRMEKLGEGRWRFHVDGVGRGYTGRKFIFWTDRHGGHGINGGNSKDCLFEDITYYGRGSNAGIILWNCSGTMTFHRYNIDVPPGSHGLISCSGGGMDIDVRGKLVYDTCDFEHFDDDGADVTTHYTNIVAQPAPNQIIVGSNTNYQVGDRLARMNWVTKDEEPGFKITNIQPVPDKSWVTLTLDKPIKAGKMGVDPPNLSFEDVLKNGIDRVVDYDNVTTSTEFLNCKFQCLRARPLNLKAQNCLVQNCTFYNCEGQAISAGPEAAWFEAPYVHNLTIRDCTFINNVITCIDVDIFQGMKECDSYGNQNILIEGNTFRHSGAYAFTPDVPSPDNWRSDENWGALAIHVHHCENVTIRNNNFGDRAATAPSFKPMLRIAHCKNVTVENNQNLPESEIKRVE